MKNTITKLLLASASASLLLAGSAFAATVTIGNGVTTVNSDPDADPALHFTNNGSANVNGVNLTGTNGQAATTDNDQEGEINFTGPSTVTGNIGTSTHELNYLEGVSGTTIINGNTYTRSLFNTATMTFNGTLTTTSQFQGSGSTFNFNGDVTGNFHTTNTTINFADGANYTGISQGDGLTGVNFAGSSTITGSLGSAAGEHMGGVAFNGGAGKVLTIDGLLYTNILSINSTGTVNINGQAPYAALIFNNGDGTLNIADGITVGGPIGNGVAGTSEGTVNFAGDATIAYTDNAGSLRVLNLLGSGHTLGMSGNFEAATATTLGDNVINAGGVTAFANGQTLSTTIDTAGAYGHITSAGAATVAAGTHVVVNVASGAPLTDGEHLTLIDGTGGSGVATLTSGNITTSTENLFVHDFTQDTTNTEDLVLVANVSTFSDMAKPRNTPQARILDSLGGGGDPGLQQTQAQLQSSTNSTQYNDRLSSLAPTTDGGNVQAAVLASESFINVSDDRLGEIRDNLMSDGPAGDPQYTDPVWAQAFGSKDTEGDRSGVAGYDANTYGTAIGFDTQNIADNLAAGASVGYAASNVKSRNFNATKDNIDNYEGNVFADYYPLRDTYINSTLGFAYNRNDQDRRDIAGVLGNDAHANYGSEQYIANLETGHRFFADQVVSATPLVYSHYQHINVDGYTEHGSTADLHVDSQSLDLLELGVGGKLEATFRTDGGQVFKPSLDAGYRYAVINDKLNDTASFTGGGGSFSTGGLSPARGTFNAGAGITWRMSAAWSAAANYDFETKSDYHANSGYVRLAYHF